MTYVWLIAGLAATLSLAMSAAWYIADRTGQSGWVDAIWSFAVGGAGAIAALVPLAESPDTTSRQLLVAALVAIWSLRLGVHIVARSAGGEDDPRYAHLRREWGTNFRARLFAFLQIQAAAALALVLTVLLAARNPAPGLRWLDGLGVVVLLAAVAGAAVADRQLARFRADPARRGLVCERGLWGLSRHPNYFFEWLGWLAYAVIAIDFGGAHPWGWLALGGPIFMYWLLVRVSGIPPLEAHMLRSRGDAYRAYQQRVNAFWPGPVRPPSHRKPAKESS